MFINRKNLEISNLKNVEKRGAGNPEAPSNAFFNFLNMGAIYSRKHEMDVW